MSEEFDWKNDPALQQFHLRTSVAEYFIGAGLGLTVLTMIADGVRQDKMVTDVRTGVQIAFTDYFNRLTEKMS